MRMAPGETLAVDMLFYEKQAYRQGFRLVAGIDEVGRGPLAGPVVAAAVVLPRDVSLPGVKDSKKLSAAQRESCREAILACACGVGIGCVDAREIDGTNILKATFKAMVLAVRNLGTPPECLLIDGPYELPIFLPQRGIPQGDAKCLSIAAASIVAKVHRDRLMCRYHQEYPVYCFDRNKGYGTADHIDALRKYGPCPLHRLSFSKVPSPGKETETADGKQISEGKRGRKAGG